jgi:Zn-dependent protease with chaperone function
MGYQGQMWGIEATLISYILAWCCLGYGVINLFTYYLEIKNISTRINELAEENVLGSQAKILNTSFPYAGLMGFYQGEKKSLIDLFQSHLVLSKGLINLLSKEHLQAVIAHEKAHQKHKDPLIFFCLSYCKNITFWLPNNEKLWNDLILLRELRADNTASKSVDFLLLAESLLMVTQEAMEQPSPMDYDFICPFMDSRLNERIEALINQDNSAQQINWYQLSWMIVVFIPFVIIPFHH